MFSPEAISAQQVEAYKQELGIKADDYLVSYVGSVGTWYMLPEMLAFFKRLKLQVP
jgi:hypothetical protein